MTLQEAGHQINGYRCVRCGLELRELAIARSRANDPNITPTCTGRKMKPEQLAEAMNRHNEPTVQDEGILYPWYMAVDASQQFAKVLGAIVKECYENSAKKGFWTGPLNDNVPTKVSLMHSELSEMLEAFRKGNPICDKKFPDGQPMMIPDGNGGIRPITSEEEEVADLAIRLFDFCGRYGYNLGYCILAKMRYNATRPHMHGNKKC